MAFNGAGSFAGHVEFDRTGPGLLVIEAVPYKPSSPVSARLAAPPKPTYKACPAISPGHYALNGNVDALEHEHLEQRRRVHADRQCQRGWDRVQWWLRRARSHHQPADDGGQQLLPARSSRTREPRRETGSRTSGSSGALIQGSSTYIATLGGGLTNYDLLNSYSTTDVLVPTASSDGLVAMLSPGDVEWVPRDREHQRRFPSRRASSVSSTRAPRYARATPPETSRLRAGMWEVSSGSTTARSRIRMHDRHDHRRQYLRRADSSDTAIAAHPSCAASRRGMSSAPVRTATAGCWAR